MALVAIAAACAASSCQPSDPLNEVPPPDEPTAEQFLDDVEHRTFLYFRETANPENGLVPDRWPTASPSSVAAIGFGLTAYAIGAERGWVSRADAADRTLTTLRFLWNAPQGPDDTGMTGYRGFFYHFLDMQDGERFRQSELSTIDTALMMMGVLAAQQYFDGDDAREREIRALADSLYRRVEWDWAVVREPAISMAWRPGRGFSDHDYDGYDEAMFLYVLALGSPTHPVEPEAWTEFTSTYQWAEFYGYEHVNFAPLFGHQYAHAWIDFRGIQDAYMRERGMDYFENSRRAALAQRAYAIDNPGGWTGYGENVWGLTASDGPGGFTATIAGRERTFHGYWARGAAAGDIRDDGTLAPTALGGSIPFAPEVTIPALQHLRQNYGQPLYGEYGFRDAFNLTLAEGTDATKGRIVPGVGWFDDDYIGIDQGAIVLMIENYRTGLVWQLMQQNPYIVRGLCRAGFTGGWIAGRCD
ncbi:MAG TPA: glucoamylase family protein [Woeseiaceae bacterium]|nr:glucoamylase family protein [Woeseiaceae bacterium]